MNGSCANGCGIRRTVIEERVLPGLKEKLVAPEAAAEAMRAWTEETNRLNRARRASTETDRPEMEAVKKKITAMIDVIEDGGYVQGMIDRPRELKARQDELETRLADAPATLPDIHPNVAGIYRDKVERLAAALDNPGERDEAAVAIRGLIERIVLTPGVAWGEMDAKLVGDLGTILEWASAGDKRRRANAPSPHMSVSVVAGARFEPAAYKL